MGINAYFWKMVAPDFSEWDLVQELLNGLSDETQYPYCDDETEE